MQVASQAFQKGDIKQAIEIYTAIIDNHEDKEHEALLNRASMYFSSGGYLLSINDAKSYLSTNVHPSVQGYIMLANCLIKTKAIISEEERAMLDKGRDQFPYHKKYLDTLKIVYELQITQNEQEYLEKIFEKLLSVPTIRKYMSEESFLTKVEKMITNPSLAGALIKLDERLAEVQEVILMADV